MHFRASSLVGLLTFRVGGSSPTYNGQSDQVQKMCTTSIATIPGPVTAFSNYTTQTLNLLDSCHAQTHASQLILMLISTFNHKENKPKLDITP